MNYDKKISELNDFANKARNKNPAEMLSYLISLKSDPSFQNTNMSDDETELILSQLKKNMSPKDIGKIEAIRNLSKIITAKSNT